MKVITEQFIKDELNKEFQGKAVTGYDYISVADSVRRILQDFFADVEEVNAKDFGCTYDKWHLTMTYRGKGFGSVDIKRKKGKSHWGTFGGWCDWTYKDFSVYVRDDFIGTLANIEGELEAQAVAEAKRLAQYKEIFDLIKTKYGMTDYQAKSFVEGMHSKRYSLY